VPDAVQRLDFQGVVIVADLIVADQYLSPHLRRNLEQTDQRTLQNLNDAITSLGLHVVHYSHPKLLAKHARRHAGDVVLSIFGGSTSRSRMALVPAICETFGLSFIGPDAYGRIVCQDKEVSKALATTAGLKTPPHRIIRSTSDLDSVSDFTLPYVVKPLWEGSSIGIGPESLVTDRQSGRRVAEQMLERFDQPIMVESFVRGREVSWCYIEGPRSTGIRSLAEIVWDGQQDYFDRHLYDAHHKLSAEGRKAIRNISHELQQRDASAMEKLLALVGPTGYGRIDGKLIDGSFIFLEITPDAWLGPTGTFACSFADYGLSFDQIIARILLSARRGHPSRSPNDSGTPDGT
jgi:D-alanine-D-alanine ligase